MKQLFFFFLVLLSLNSFAQKPRNGTYFYQIRDAEFGGRFEGKVKVVIKRDSIYVYATDDYNFNAKKGKLIEKGRLIFHKTFKKWIIAVKTEDENAKAVGGCSGGPTTIDIKNKWYWRC